MNLDKFGWKLLVFSPPRITACINPISASNNLWSDWLEPDNLCNACGSHKAITKGNYGPSSVIWSLVNLRGGHEWDPILREKANQPTWTSIQLGNEVIPGSLQIAAPCLRPSNWRFLACGPPLFPPLSFIFKAMIRSAEQRYKVFLKCRQMKFKCSSPPLLIILQRSPSTLCIDSDLNGDCKMC